MNNIELISIICLAVIVIVLTIISIIILIKKDAISKVTPVIKEAMQYAENNITGSSNKLQYVLDKVTDKCNQEGIPLGLTIKLSKKLIEKVIKYYNFIAHDE